MPDIKEADFFSGPPEDIPYARGSRRIETLEEYERLFDPTVAVRGEASPSYTVYPLRKGVPERIKAVIPEAKLIYLVRDPVVRAVSHYQHSVSAEGEHRSLRDALNDFSNPYCTYTCPGFYAAQLERYLCHFPNERILVIDQAALLANRSATLRDIFAFLSVDDSFTSPKFDEQMNTGQERRTYSYFTVFHRWAKATPLQRLPRGFRRSLRRSVERLVSQPLEIPSLDIDLQIQLQELYADDVKRLRELTGRTFPTWTV